MSMDGALSGVRRWKKSGEKHKARKQSSMIGVVASIGGDEK
jgi:hypothetical protein